MSVPLPAGRLYPWLPESVRSLYDWIKRDEPTWGYSIYRTTYTAQSDATFPAAVELITAYMKWGFYQQYIYLCEDSRTGSQADKAVFDELWAAYSPHVIEDASRYDGASIDQLRTEFEEWTEEQDKTDLFPSYRMFIVDEESLQTLQNAPIPTECPVGMQHRVAYYVKIVEAGQDEDPDEIFPGWMKCSLKSLWDIWTHMQDGDYMRDSHAVGCEDRDVY